MSEPQAVEQQALNLGWAPKEQWRGDPDKWVDASTFVKRGEEIMPILKKNNQELQTKVDSAQAEIRRLNEAFKQSQDAIEALKEHQSAETKRQVSAARADLVARLKAAKKAGDTDLEVDISEELVDLDKAVAEAKPTAPKKDDAPATPATDPVFAAWRAENTWFDTDPVRQATAIGIANKLRSDPANANLQGKAFFDRVGDEVAVIFDKAAPRRQSKVEGSDGGGGSGGGGVRERGFNDLPPDAKATCERQAARLVGPNKAFKDNAAWQKHYANIYFSSEA